MPNQILLLYGEEPQISGFSKIFEASFLVQSSFRSWPSLVLKDESPSSHNCGSPHSWKLNVDASWNEVKKYGGIGGIVRDYKGVSYLWGLTKK